ncbi:MAG: hypothetical protein E7624_09135 [Ruminococcaceae bacterium]|nr:hypothetical protein [Oscillospiraceae bacterium]
MENQNNSQSFRYTYSPKQQEELKRIRAKYLPPEEDKMEQIRRLDARVYNKACICALIVGILGALIFGTGLCCCLVWQKYVLGVIVGVVGAMVCTPAYPLFLHITKKERARVAPEILRLTDELLK